jgi:hypothetical protein
MNWWLLIRHGNRRGSGDQAVRDILAVGNLGAAKEWSRCQTVYRREL